RRPLPRTGSPHAWPEGKGWVVVARVSGCGPGERCRPCALCAYAPDAPPGGSPAQAEPLDQRPVAADVGLLQVVQQPAPAADEQQQATTAVVVMLVRPQVLGQVGDAPRQDRDLDLGRTGVALLGRVLR